MSKTKCSKDGRSEYIFICIYLLNIQYLFTHGLVTIFNGKVKYSYIIRKIKYKNYLKHLNYCNIINAKHLYFGELKF